MSNECVIMKADCGGSMRLYGPFESHAHAEAYIKRRVASRASSAPRFSQYNADYIIQSVHPVNFKPRVRADGTIE